MPYKNKKEHVLLDSDSHKIIKKEHEDSQIPVWKIMENALSSSTYFKKLKKKWEND